MTLFSFLLFLILFSYSVLGDNLEIVTSAGNGATISAEQIWDGGIYVTFRAVNDTKFYVPDFLQLPFKDTELGELAPVQPYGFERFKHVILPLTPNQADVTSTVASLTLKPAVGFVTSSIIKGLIDLSLYSVSTSGVHDDISGALTITPNSPGGGLSSFSVLYGRNEHEVRTKGICVQITLKYNVFKNPQLQAPVAFYNYTPALTGWSQSLTVNGTVISLVLPPRPNFNISKRLLTSFVVTLSSADVYLPLVATKLYSSPIAVVDNIPQTYCLLNTTLIYENSLTQGPQRVKISLEDPSVDSFDTLLPKFKEILIEGIKIPPSSGINATVVSYNTSFIIIDFYVGVDFDIFIDYFVYVAVPPVLLMSKESGCGGVTIKFAPSPGTVKGIGFDSLRLSELNITENTTTLHLRVEKDLFIQPTVTPIMVRQKKVEWTLPNTSTTISHWFAEVVASTGRLVVKANGTMADLIFPKNTLYNIPYGAKEVLEIVVPGSVLSSGVAPMLEDATFEIVGVEATFTVTFNGPTETSVSIPALWNASDSLIVWFTLRADRWRSDAINQWSFRRPLFYSAFFSLYNTVDRPVLEFTKITIDPTNKIAFAPMRSIPNISTAVEERVLVDQITSLTEGQTTTFSSFLILRTNRSLIKGTYGGMAEDIDVKNPKIISEDDVRNGLTFYVTLTNQVFSSGYNFSVNASRIFDRNPGSLAPFVSQAVGTLDSFGTTLTITFPPLPTYDIYRLDGIGLRVPDAFYSAELGPESYLDGSINIETLPGPTCRLNISSNITEVSIREGEIRFSIIVNPTFVSDTTLSDLTGNITARAASGDLLIEPEYIKNNTILHMVIRRNQSYDIVAPDTVSVIVPRFLFNIKEGCPGPLTFEVGVQAGTVSFANLPTSSNESYFRSHETMVTLTVNNEKVTEDSFSLVISAQTGRSPRGLKASFQGLTVTATRFINDSNVFVFTLPRLPMLSVFDIEQFQITIPIAVLASHREASYENNTVSVRPVAEAITARYNVSIDEQEIVLGGSQCIFNAPYGKFVNGSTIVSTLALVNSDLTQQEASQIRELFAPSHITFSSDGSQMNITFPPSPNFNLLSGNLSVTFELPPEVMASHIAPIPSSFTFVIFARPPRLVFSGSALNGGSKDLIMGTLELHIEVINDRFSDQLDSRVCHRQFECLFITGSDSRFATIRISSSSEFTSIREVTYYTLTFPPSVFYNKIAPVDNTVVLAIYPQGGILEPVVDLSPTYDESTIREGELTSFTLRITGDEFVTDQSAIIDALIAGVTCTPLVDSFDFCGRLRNIIHSIKLTGTQSATVMLQQDLDFDIYVLQTVTIQIAGAAFLSKQAPVPRETISFTIYQTAGTVYYSNAALSASASVIGNENADPPLDIAFTFTLVGERWGSDATNQIITSLAVSPATQANGFFALRRNLFSPAVISASGRVAVLRMKSLNTFSIATAETITMYVNAEAVMSRIRPNMISTNNQFIITVSGGALQLTTPSTYFAKDVAASGIKLAIASSVFWDSLEVTETALRSGVFASSSSVATEPNGFTRYSTWASGVSDSLAMAPSLTQGLAPGDTVLFITIPAHRDYSLLKPETIGITLPVVFQQGSNKAPYTPSTLHITVLPSVGELLLLVRNPITAGEIAQRVATLLGILVNRINVLQVLPYGDAGGLFSKVTFSISEPSAVGPPTISAAEAAARMKAAATSITKECCNISATFWSANPPSSEEMDIALGLAAAPEFITRMDDTMWVYIGLAILAVIAIGIIVWWRVYGSVMDSGRNRVQREEPEANFVPLLFVPKEDWEGNEEVLSKRRTTDAGADIEEELSPIRRENQRIEGDTDEFTGPLLSLGGRVSRMERAGHKVTLDVDDNLHAGQLPHIFLEETSIVGSKGTRQPTVYTPPPLTLPMTEEDVVVYPPGYHSTPEYKAMRQRMSERQRQRRHYNPE